MIMSGMKKAPAIRRLADDRGNVVGEIVTCGHCGAFICDTTEKEKEVIYQSCTHCGMGIDWGDGVSEVRSKKLDQPKEEAMGDLISREAVIEVLKETGIILDNDLGHLIVEEINRIPIAYDLDKVVEKLKLKADWNYKVIAKTHPQAGLASGNAFYKAIEIVKGGNV